MRVLLFGANGQVGHELVGPLDTIGELVALRRADCDMADPEAIRRAVRDARPNLIVNATAYNAVDGAEDDREGAFAINAEAVKTLGELSMEVRAGLIHMSTDYVFDGQSSEPFSETHATNPLGAYGASKLAGEQALVDMGAPAITLRTSWVFSARPCFVARMLDLAAEREALSIVSDQLSCPTFARDLAVAISHIAARCRGDAHDGIAEHAGVYHLAGRGVTNRFELVQEAIAQSRAAGRTLAVQSLTPVPAATFPAKADRPMYSALSCDRAQEVFRVRLPDWRDAVRRCFC